MIEEGEVSELNQLARALEESFESLEKSYKKDEPENFNKAKKILIQTQKRILEISQ